MHQHGPDELLGPLRGTAAWWRGMGATPESSGEGTQVELCNRGQNTQRLHDDPEIRADLVERVRNKIAAGAYDRPDIWEKTLDRLLDRLDGA